MMKYSCISRRVPTPTTCYFIRTEFNHSRVNSKMVDIAKIPFLSHGFWWNNNFDVQEIGPWSMDDLIVDWLMISSEFICTKFSKKEGMNLSIGRRTKSSTNQPPDYRWSTFLESKMITASNPTRNKCFFCQSQLLKTLLWTDLGKRLGPEQRTSWRVFQNYTIL